MLAASSPTDLIGIGIVVVAAVAGVIGYFKANVSKSTIELYKEDNTALRLRLDTLEDDLKLANTKITALTDANRFLASVVTQADAIAAVRATVERIAAKVGA